MADINVLTFPEVDTPEENDIIYNIRGTGNGRDKKIKVSNLTGKSLEVTDTEAIDLSDYGADLVIFANKSTAFTVTFSNYLLSGKNIQVVGVGAGLVTLAGTITDVVIQNEVRKHVSSGTAFYNRNSSPLKVDTINERTSATGVTVDGVLLKDNTVTASGGVKTDSTFLKTKVIDIGDWNMNTASSTNIVSIGTLDYKKIRGVDVVIRNDTGGQHNSLVSGLTVSGDGGAIRNYGSTGIQLERIGGGIFDAPSYSSTSYNRGWITITYES